jgi:serine/threonine-protein kinase
MASVYKAYEPGLERSVAVKVLPPEYLHDPTFAERFRREAQVIARLEHPHIIPIYAYGIDSGMPWMSMRLVAGGSLASLLREGGRLTNARTLRLLGGVASALDYAHAAGVIHRDVKPQNILIDEHQHVYLADFGIAKMVEGAPGLTQTGMITGTPQYMAPEQALGSAPDYRADIYGLGVVAYECLTGRVPFTADTPLAVLMKHVRDPIPLPPVAEVPEPLSQVVLKALAKAPGDRWATAQAFVDALHQAGETATLHVPPTVVVPKLAGRTAPPRPALARPRPMAAVLWAAGAALAAAMLAVAAWMAWRSARPEPGPPGSAPQAATPMPEGPAPASQAAAPTPEAPALAPDPTLAAAAVSPQARPTLSPTAPTAERPATRPVAAAVSAPTTPPATAAPPASERPTPAPPPTPTAGPPRPVTAPVASETPPQPERVPAPIEPVPRREAEAPGSRGIAFALGSPIALGEMRQAPITLLTATFKFVAKSSELQVEVAGRCDEGKDQAVDIQVELLDASGAAITTIKGRGGIEEEDEGKIRAKQHLTQSVVASIARFRLTFQTQPD